MRQQELQDEEERMHKRLEVSSSNVNVAVADVEYSSNAGIFILIKRSFRFFLYV